VEGTHLVFYVRNLGRRIAAKKVHHPGWGRDLLADEFARAGRSFVIRTVDAFSKELESTISSMQNQTIRVRRG
jgi:hypothetical protein